MNLPANQYLDARRPEWTPSEKDGLVQYDAPSRRVTVYDFVIADALRRAG